MRHSGVHRHDARPLWSPGRARECGRGVVVDITLGLRTTCTRKPPMLEYIGLALGMLGLLSAYYFYVRSKREIRPTVIYSRRVIQTRDHPEVSIRFRGTEVTTLHQLLVVFWNAGTQEIRQADIPTTNPPHVVFHEACQVLSPAVLSVSNSATNFRLEQLAPSQLALRFDFLNPQDGAVFEVLYDPASDDAQVPFEIEGSLIGAQSMKVFGFAPAPSPWNLLFFALIAGGIFAFDAGLVFDAVREGSWGNAAAAAVMLLVPAGGLYVLYRQIRDMARQRVPAFAKSHFQ